MDLQFEFDAYIVLPGIVDRFKPIVRLNGRTMIGRLHTGGESFASYDEAIESARGHADGIVAAMRARVAS